MGCVDMSLEIDRHVDAKTRLSTTTLSLLNGSKIVLIHRLAALSPDAYESLEVCVRELSNGDHPPGDYFIDKAGKLTKRPERTQKYYEWDADALQWVDARTVESESSLVLSQRNKMLQNSDWTDTLSAPERLGVELYNAWQTYRQALRDITDQPGYPFDVAWPTPPA